MPGQKSQDQQNFKYKQKQNAGQSNNAIASQNSTPQQQEQRYIPKNNKLPEDSKETQNKTNQQYQKKDAADNYKQKGGQGQYQKNQGQKPYKQYTNNQNNQYQKGYQNRLPAQNYPQFFPHHQNLQQMDQSELQSVLFQVLTHYGPDLLQMSGASLDETQDTNSGFSTLLKQLSTGELQSQINQNKQSQGGVNKKTHKYDQQKQYATWQQKEQNPLNSMPQPPPPNNPFSTMSSNVSSFDPSKINLEFPSLQNPFPPTNAEKSTTPTGSNMGVYEEKKQQSNENQDSTKNAFGQQDGLIPNNFIQQQSLMYSYCEKHFPEPIIFMGDKSLCKKCIPEYMESIKNKSLGSSKQTKGEKQENMVENELVVANILGISQYDFEKNLIQKYLFKLDDFNGDFRYLHDEIKERAQESQDNLENLPELTCQIFDQGEITINQLKNQFLSEIDSIIAKQQAIFSKDNEQKVPQFYQRLSQKYNQLQEATQNTDSMSQEALVEILIQYLRIFNDLDAEFEKCFNEFENVSKLQRLLDKDENEIIKGFSNLVETNLRVDYNVKNSFQPGVPSRIHSFQWNQKYAYIYKVHSQSFEKRSVQMEIEVPLYSRSIATEDGGIYLIGGCNKKKNQYLKKCYKYNTIFGNLDEKAQMIYPHADHSLCSIEGFIYVVGTFVNSQVYGFCEVYDIQMDQWNQIDSLRVARSGVALSSFKNKYIFAFGGRTDQKKIVDVIECYDISKNVWQEISSPLIDKSEWIPGYMSLSYQITDNEILIFGGKSALTFQIFNGCFVFDVQKMEIKEQGKLVNPCSFMNTPLVFKGTLYAFGNDIYIHKYNIAEQKWSCIPKQFP